MAIDRAIDPFVPWGVAAPEAEGPRLAVKDVFDVEGLPTGAGHPGRLGEPAERDAEAVARLRAMSVFAGKTHTDELAWSLGGINQHYGAVENPAAPGHVCGGSSSGSAAAVAGGLADIGLGTDTAGSVRVPASYCGLYGFRPTHSRVPQTGMVPLAPSYDVPGLLTRDLPLLEWAVDALLDPAPEPKTPERVWVPADLWSELSPRVGAALAPAIRRLGLPIDRTSFGLDVTDAFAVTQAAEVWECHGDWVRAERPEFGPGVAARFERAERLTSEEVSLAAKNVAEARLRLLELLDGAVMALPSAPGVAPVIGRPSRMRAATLRLTCLAPIAGAPVLSLPVTLLDSCPLGLSLMAAPGGDMSLFALASGV
ncbi:amidase family protein [Herbidospora mongoliensis]|uniref:amidase family protein n=1 Tax=Herbidospora mongoliensis TaxID=688067 RepID=UPI00082D0A22|nr:amidase family protein [Herbidospora mongoliensis]